jgi:hypothetical protein
MARGNGYFYVVAMAAAAKPVWDRAAAGSQFPEIFSG